ncbi:MAG: hypothetical protein KBF78_15290 [Fuscovulum sp.]|nr:hypothetical protein [Fuscovulum sp.]
MVARAVLIAALLAGPAGAEGRVGALSGGLSGALFPSDASCYLRQYSAAHLAAHPDQRVTQIALGPWGPAWGKDRDLVLTVAVYLTGDAERYSGAAWCRDAGPYLHCRMEGDAGSFALEAATGRALRMTLTGDGIGFEGPRDFVELSARTGDDRVFLIPPVPADACP